MTGEFTAFDTQQSGIEDERLLERKQTRVALQSASDELVDMTVQTPWERNRSRAEDSDNV